MGGGVGLETCKMGIHPPAETCTAPTIITLLLVIPPGPTLQAPSGAGVDAAAYTGYRRIHQSIVRSREQKTKGPYREKSINNASDELHESLQRDFVALPSLVPDLYLAFPRFVPRPLQCRP